MTDDTKQEREALADELQAAGEHPCRAHLAFGKLLRDGAAALRQPQTDALKIAREALRDIQIEAEREQGSWVHLKRVIALNCKQTLAALDALGFEIREKGQ